ncbi:MAG TPA: aldehyde dehydrogenase (NADP(+)) [Caulifigura sp.]|nr:aldehyde dehydrogenase (NADP(+)) [Caulifigura sp.]
MPASIHPVLLSGQWKPSVGRDTFTATNPATRAALPDVYPVSPWSEIEEALVAADRAFQAVRQWPGERFARFLEAYADRIEARAADLIAAAHLETALPVEPRLKVAELPRTINQLRQAAAAAREGSWALPTIDTKQNIRSIHAPLGPVAVFGPNNFPFAFNGISGGDFAAAVAAGCPVIAKGHPSHPTTTRLFAEAAHEAAQAAEMPAGFVQLVYRISHADGEKLAGRPLLGSIGYTGARHAGLVLKRAADAVGKPIYLELSSINPVYILPGAVAERGDKLAEEFTGSCLMGAGQFCTNPGLVFLVAGPQTESFIADVAKRFDAAPVGTLLGPAVEKSLNAGLDTLRAAGAKQLTTGKPDAARCSVANTLLRVDAKDFLKDPHRLQTEAFGNSSLIVVAKDEQELLAVTDALEGNLTGCIYSATAGADDALYDKVAPALRHKVGRLLNDKMPTGVAVSPAMNHGGPFPATGHPGFTAVGIPASIRRFSALHCYDAVRPNRLPPALQNKSPNPGLARLVDGVWTTGDIPG